ncbi:MAG: hypothetical protein ACI4PM_03835 [Butyricicoccus sp.]
MKRKHTLLYLSFILIGLALAITAAVLPGDGRQSELLSCFGSVLFVIGAIKLVRLYRISRNPEKMRDYEISRKDERVHFIAARAQQWTLWLSIYTELAFGLALSYLPQNELLQHVGTGICLFICVQMITYTILYYVFNRRY